MMPVKPVTMIAVLCCLALLGVAVFSPAPVASATPPSAALEAARAAAFAPDDREDGKRDRRRDRHDDDDEEEWDEDHGEHDEWDEDEDWDEHNGHEDHDWEEHERELQEHMMHMEIQSHELDAVSRRLEVVSQVARIAESPLTTASAAIVHINDVFGEEEAIDVLHDCLRRKPDPAVRRLIRMKLAELYAESDNRREAKEQFRILIVGE